MTTSSMRPDATIRIPGLDIKRVLGAGATSTVYHVTRNGRDYALKLLRERGGTMVGEDALVAFQARGQRRSPA